jgi:autotransporter-associated beta strand protein
MQKAALQGNTLVATHAVSVSSTQDAAQWYQIDVSSGTPVLAQQGDVSLGNNTYAYYPAIDINPAGQIGMTFMDSGTGAGQFMSVYVTGRLPTDASGTMQTPVLVPAGTGQTNYHDFGPSVGATQRAGDLGGINVDPSDISFWAANEFANMDATANWGTAVANFTPSHTTHWTGGQDTNWFNASNWDNGVPGPSDTAIIQQVAHEPLLTANVSGANAVNVLCINTSATLTLNGFALTVSSSLTNQGTLILQGGETVNLTQDNEGQWNYVGDGDGTANNFTLQEATYYDLYIADTHAVPDTFQAGGALAVNDRLRVMSGTLDLNGHATTTSVLDDGGVNTGHITDNGGAATLTVNGGGSFSGVIQNGSGALALTVGGAGQTLILTGTNTYSGTTTINSGATLQIGNNTSTGSFGSGAVTDNGTLTVNRSNSITLGNAISGTGALTQAGTGTLTLSSTSNTYSGTTTISAGTFQAGATNALSANSAVSLANVASAILNLNNFNNSIASLAGGGTTGGNVTLGSGTLTIANAINGSSTAYAGVISGTGGLVINLTGTGSPVETFSGTNTYTGATTINGGVLSISADTGLGAAPGSATAGKLVINGGTLQATNTFTLNSNRGIALGPTSGSGSGTIDVAHGISLTYGGIVANNGGTGSLTQVDSGTLVLSGVNTFGGSGAAVSVTSGLLSVGADSGLGNAANTLTLNGGTLQATGTFSTARTMTLGLSGGNFDVTSGNTLTTTGAIGGPGLLSLFDSGTLTLGGGSGDTSADTYGGATNVNNGTLILNKASGVNAIPGNIGIHGGTLQWNGSYETPFTSTVNLTSGTLNFNNQSQILGGLTMSGGTVTTSTSLTANNGLQINGLSNSITGGTLTVGNSTTMFFQSLLLASPGTVTVQGGSNTEFGVGGGTLTLNAATITLNFGTAGAHFLLPGNTVTTVASSTVSQIIASGGSGTAPVVDLGGAQVVFTVPLGAAANQDLLISANMINGHVGKLGTGRLALTGSNTYTGGTDVGNGTVFINSPGMQAATGNTQADVAGTIAGTGNAGNIVAVAGQVSPGVGGPGTLSGSSLTLDANSMLNMNINGTTAGTQYSQVSLTGNANLGSATLSAIVGYVPAVNDSYTLITTMGTITGTFKNLPNHQVFTLSGLTYQITYTTTAVTVKRYNVGTITLTATVNPVDTTKGHQTVGLSTITVNGSGATANSLVTVSDTLGLVIQGGPGNVTPPNGSTNGDADLSTPGFQVTADGSGNFNFTLVAQQAGMTTVTATEETGATTGMTTATYNQPLTYHVQFTDETEANPAIQQGTTPLTATTTVSGTTATAIAPYFPNTPQTVFSVSRGYGWITAVGSGLGGSYDQGPFSGSLPGAITNLQNLQRSGAFGTSMIFAMLGNSGNTYMLTVYLGNASTFHQNQHVLVMQTGGTFLDLTPSGVSTGTDATHGGFATVTATLSNDGMTGHTHFALDAHNAIEIEFTHTGTDTTDGKVDVNGIDLVDPTEPLPGASTLDDGVSRVGAWLAEEPPTSLPMTAFATATGSRLAGVETLSGVPLPFSGQSALDTAGASDLAALLAHHRVRGGAAGPGGTDGATAAQDQVFMDETSPG